MKSIDAGLEDGRGSGKWEEENNAKAGRRERDPFLDLPGRTHSC